MDREYFWLKVVHLVGFEKEFADIIKRLRWSNRIFECRFNWWHLERCSILIDRPLNNRWHRTLTWCFCSNRKFQMSFGWHLSCLVDGWTCIWTWICFTFGFMHQKMFIQAVAIVELFRTYFTVMCCFACVDAHMNRQITPQCECFST